MILFFSGTGNSKYVAKVLSKRLNDDVCDLSEYTRQGSGGYFNSDKPFVLVCPTYASYLPLCVIDVLKKSTFLGNKYFYLIMTCGSTFSSYGTNFKIKPILKKLGLTYKGIKQVVMPENYITLYFAPKQETANKIIDRSLVKINKISDKITENKNLFKISCPSVFTHVVNPIFYKTLVKDKPFYTTNECISCGKCEKICPLNNIKLENGRPIWKGNCTQCMACISTCPKTAIEYGKRSKGKRRYYLDI